MKSKYMILAMAISSVAILSQTMKAQEGYPPQAYGSPPVGMYDPGFQGGGQMPYADPAAVGYYQQGYATQPPYQTAAYDPAFVGTEQTAYFDEPGLQPIAEGSVEEYDFVGSYCPPGVAPKVFGGVEYLYVWRKGQSFEGSLLATSTDPDDEAVIGTPTTTSLFGLGREQDSPRSGARLTLGVWLDDYQNWGLGSRGIALEREVLGISATTADYPTMGHPFFNTNTGLNDSVVISKPGVGDNAANDATTNIRSENNFYSGDIFLTKHLWTKHANRWDFVTGYSYLQVEDGFSLSSQFTVQDLGGSIPTGTVVNFNDMFNTHNEFHGGHVGIMGELQDGPITWRLLSKIALGQMHQEASIAGSYFEDSNPLDNEGIYARDSNSGNYSQNRFAFIPEFNIDMIYALTGNLDMKFGTTFIYVSDIATPGSVMDPRLDPTGATLNPAFNFNTTDYWVLGLNCGVDFHF
ncbi:MAG: BBP7 family outer membrane beta-barrel protein [Pirellulales bacterium]